MRTTTTARIPSGQTLRRTREPEIRTDPIPRIGPFDCLTIDEVIDRIPSLPLWVDIPHRRRATRLNAAERILQWLHQYPGDGWQARWEAAADRSTEWLDAIVADDPGSPAAKRAAMTYGLTLLFICRIVLPGYGFLSSYRPRTFYAWVRKTHRPDLFDRLNRAADDLGMQAHQRRDAVTSITKMVLHTARDVDQLTADDLHEHREWFYRGVYSADRGIHGAWRLLQSIEVLPKDVSMGSSQRRGPRSVEELVDYYQIQNHQMRDLFVRYLKERQPSLDYGSLRGLATVLAGRFWADIEQHQPGISSLAIPADVATEWKQRHRTVRTSKGETKPRKSYLNDLAKIRAFYLNIQEWAQEDPSWAEWAAPSPVRQNELVGMAKARKKTVSEMHQRVRDRLPQLSLLVNSTDDYKNSCTSLLAAATATPVGETFHRDGTAYLRTLFKSYLKDRSLPHSTAVVIQNLETGEQINITEAEDDAFWTWAIIETLRHTGIRIEELLEITQLALVSYRLPDTGETVPLLQIAPSKSDEERVLLVPPELASVFASIVKRLRDHNNGHVSLVARYDLIEKVTNPPLPHLFQRKNGWRPSVISPSVVKRMLNAAVARTGLRDSTGQPLTYTPHDFRRMFATDAVTGGLPVHIAAKLLGHHNLATTQSYLAVFQDDLIRTYRAFVDKRRAMRPSEEYREPTDEEWTEFQQHFALRKVELGDCGRPYGSGCQHEHACVRCPMLRVDPRQKPRLQEIIANLTDRINEARGNGWLGEVEGLKTSRAAAENKLAALNRSIRNKPGGPTLLGLPATRQEL